MTSPRRQIAIASLAALAAIGVAGMTLPASVFQASAIVAVDEPSAALRLAAARSAADLAVSKPVIARAAASLNGTIMPAPAPALVEKLGVATGLMGATGTVARLADALAPEVTASAGDGLIEVQARAADGARAAHIATALAEALIAEEEGSVAAAARRRDGAIAARVENLREMARTAHARLAELGGSETNPAEALATAGAATRAADTRLAAVHAVIAAGTPPLGAGSELPQNVANLQQTYWELKKQLDKASETMGERHTTVIALRDGVSRAAAALTAEWQRIERGAASDVAVARSREAVLRRTVTVVDRVKGAALDEARSAARLADIALARAAGNPADAATLNTPYRLVAPAAVPAAALRLVPWQRSAIASCAGLGAFALAWMASTRRRRGWPFAPAQLDGLLTIPNGVAEQAEDEAATAPQVPETKASQARPATIEPLVAARDAILAAAEDRTVPVDVRAAPAISFADDQHQPDYDYFASDWPDYEPEPVTEERIVATMPFEAASFDAETVLATEAHRPPSTAGILDADLRDAMRAIAADLVALTEGSAATTVMVAANAAGADTGAVALALGQAAAELGYRVLVIEGERARPTLAEAVAPDGDPLLVDAFGALRVALPAERGGGLFLAPALRDGARIAAALARNTQAELIDDLATAFDAVIIDGGRAADSAAAGWSADAFIRVGRFASHKDDAYLLDVFDAAPEALLGTVAAGRFVARETPPAPRAAARPALRAVPASPDISSARRPATPPSSPLRVPPRRRISAR